MWTSSPMWVLLGMLQGVRGKFWDMLSNLFSNGPIRVLPLPRTQSIESISAPFNPQVNLPNDIMGLANVAEATGYDAVYKG